MYLQSMKIETSRGMWQWGLYFNIYNTGGLLLVLKWDFFSFSFCLLTLFLFVFFVIFFFNHYLSTLAALCQPPYSGIGDPSLLFP